MMYDIGQGVAQNYHEAVKWYRLAARQGDTMAQYNLALMYDIGQGLSQDRAEAYVWFSVLAANSNDAHLVEARDRTASELSSSRLSAARKKAARLAEEIHDHRNSQAN